MWHGITKRLEFDAGHRLLEHDGACKYLHGHHYVAEISVTAPGLDNMNMVLDFGRVKEIVGSWIQQNWDHNLILNVADPLFKLYMTDLGEQTASTLLQHPSNTIFSGKAPYHLDGNPTAENMAKELWTSTNKFIPSSMTIYQVRMWETPTCYADFQPLSR